MSFKKYLEKNNSWIIPGVLVVFVMGFWNANNNTNKENSDLISKVNVLEGKLVERDKEIIEWNDKCDYQWYTKYWTLQKKLGQLHKEIDEFGNSEMIDVRDERIPSWMADHLLKLKDTTLSKDWWKAGVDIVIPAGDQPKLTN